MHVEGGKKTTILPPPWEALPLVAEFLDPKSLALASSVCKSWREVMSANHLWLSHLLYNFPSAKYFLDGSDTSPRNLFAVLRSAYLRRRRRNLPPPRISLANLVFAVDVFHKGSETCILSVAKRGSELTKSEVFHFEIECGNPAPEVECGADDLKMTWTVVMDGCRGAFSMMEGAAKGRKVGPNAVWFSEELPRPECCCSPAAVGGRGGALVAEVGLEFAAGGEEERKRMRTVRVGMMADLGCRYLGLDDGLLYLQSFLLG